MSERCSLSDGHGPSACTTQRFDCKTGEAFDCTRPFHATGPCEWQLRAEPPTDAPDVWMWWYRSLGHRTALRLRRLADWLDEDLSPTPPSTLSRENQ